MGSVFYVLLTVKSLDFTMTSKDCLDTRTPRERAFSGRNMTINMKNLGTAKVGPKTGFSL